MMDEMAQFDADLGCEVVEFELAARLCNSKVSYLDEAEVGDVCFSNLRDTSARFPRVIVAEQRTTKGAVFEED